MKQILQHLRTGATEVADVPCPSVSSGQLLVRSTHSLISAGTERMLVDFGKASLLAKARQQPDKVRQVFEKIGTDGLMPTINAVVNKLDQPLPLGYCNVGCVVAIGKGVSGFAVNDRVASNGRHAEVVGAPAILCALIPNSVSNEDASFTVIGAIALQGVRLIQPTLGEAVVVTGMGLIGLMTVQLLRAHGCRVLGIDFNSSNLELAKQFGAEIVDLSLGQDPIAAAETFSRGRGVDAVIVTAATKSNEPMHQAALMCRKRGRIVLVGVTGLELSRDDFFKKELTFQVSCSYGPGLYDPNYEEKGQDYPVGFVRLTEQRNLEAVFDMMSDGRLNVKPLVSHRFAITEAEQAYDLVGGGGPSLGILLEYPDQIAKADAEVREQTVSLTGSNVGSQPIDRSVDGQSQAATVAFIGSGNYSTAVLIPAFKAGGARMKTVASAGGVSGVHAGRKFGFEATTTDTASVFADPSINAVVITTRHDSHASLVCKALRAGKHVFVEKPLALRLDEIAEIQQAHTAARAAGGTPIVMVGFNRRFASQVQRIHQLLRGVTGPKSFIMTVNAGAIPAEHWTQDRQSGGGRIVGEGCHFIDLIRFLAGSPISAIDVCTMDAGTGDTVSIQLAFHDGSIGAVHYFANGTKAFPKERLEVFAAGRVLQLDNFRKLRGFAWPGFRRMNLWSQDKGQKACAKAFIDAVQEGRGSAPIPFEEIIEVAKASIEAADFPRNRP